MVLFPAWQGCVAIEHPEDDGSYSLPFSKRPGKKQKWQSSYLQHDRKEHQNKNGFVIQRHYQETRQAKTSVKHAECRGSLIVAGFVRRRQVETEA